MKLIALCMFLLVFVGGSFGQGSASLHGRITVSGTGVKDTEIYLYRPASPGSPIITKTDANGGYRFESVLPGKYILKVSAPATNTNFEDTASITLGDGETKAFDFELVVKTKDLGTVSVSAGSTQPIDEVSKTVNVIDGQEMRDRADFSLADTLRTIPGFRVQQLGGFGRTASVKTRGLRNQDTAVLIDGIRFRDASAITGDASPFLSDITLTSVSRVEVLRGSGSSLYGTNAIGGTVDLQTPKPQSGLHGQVSGAVGGLGLGRFRGNISDATGDEKYGFNLGLSRTVYKKGIDGNDDALNTNFQSRIELNPFKRTNVSARFFVSDAFVRLNSEPDTVGVLPFSNAGVIRAIPGNNFIFDVDDPDNSQRSKFFNGQVAISQVVSESIILNGYYSRLNTTRRNVNGPLGAGFQSDSTSIFDGSVQTVNGHVSWTPNGTNNVIAGYEYENEHFRNEGFSGSGANDFFTRASQSSSTFYLQDLAQFFGGRLQIAGGFRAYIFGLGAPQFSLLNSPYSGTVLKRPPGAYTLDGSAAYFVKSSGTKFRVHVGNGYRVPSLFERFGTFFSSFGSASFTALGDPGLKPERSIAGDAGVEQYLAGEKIKLSAVYFYTRLIDTIGFGNVVPDIGPTPRPFGGYLNTHGGIARGAELSGNYKPSRLTDIFASYTFTNSDQREPQVSGSGVIQTLGIPDRQFTLVATQRFRRFWVNLDLLATSGYLAPIFSSSTFNSYVYEFKGNRRADLTAGYTFKMDRDRLSLRVYGTVENLFGYEYFENGFRTPGRNARVGLNFGF